MKPARKSAAVAAHPDPWRFLSTFTSARIGLGRAGGSLPTQPLLEFQLAHARARDAVQRDLDVSTLANKLAVAGHEIILLHSAARDRTAFIARPDLGRILDDDSRRRLEARPPATDFYDCAFVLADGLSAPAIEHHAIAFLAQISAQLTRDDWKLAPLSIVQQGRVAVADEIGVLLRARMTVLLIGERPGLSSPDSLGIYITYDPLPGRTNAERNCISNIRQPDGLSYAAGAHTLHHLMIESRQRRLTGIALKEDAPALTAPDIAGSRTLAKQRHSS